MNPLRRTLLLLTLAACACRTNPAATRLDLQAYLQAMSTWAPVEAETARALERILATEFVDEATVVHQIADSRPRVLAHLARVRAYAPRTSPVQRIHTRYVDAWEQLLAGYDAIEKGFATGDYSHLARGREAMAAWRDGLLAVAQELRRLASGVGVETAGSSEASRRPGRPQSVTQRT